jgi:hypothetical protein
MATRRIATGRQESHLHDDVITRGTPTMSADDDHRAGEQTRRARKPFVAFALLRDVRGSNIR